MKQKFVLKTVLAGVLVLPLIFFSCKKEGKEMRSKEYSLAANGASGVTGKVLITENPDASFNIALTLNKSEKDTLHLVKLYNGRLTSPGTLALDLTTLKGSGSGITGKWNSIKQLRDPNNVLKNVTYDSILNYNAYMKVHFSAFKSDSIICQGNVGK
jgi:hypothetical protein